MMYITAVAPERTHQVTADDIFSGRYLGVDNFVQGNRRGNTVTRIQAEPDPKLLERFWVPGMVLELKRFTERHAGLYEVPRQELYRKFFIPKKTGGMREINEPVPELMEALREFKAILVSKFAAMHHTSAYAYVQGRSTIDAVKKHQRNRSWWFLKTDFSDFFGSTTKEFVWKMLEQIFPFPYVMEFCGKVEYDGFGMPLEGSPDVSGKRVLDRALDLCFLNGGLPMGTPISPMLTNLAMIPIDHAIANEPKFKRFAYTRYADDIILSSRVDFPFREVVGEINGVLRRFGAPFQIKDSKTRYGSRSGSNWNLGVMLNKDNEITIGWRKRNRFKAMVTNYVLDRKNGRRWSVDQVHAFQGTISYYSMVEKEWVEGTIAKYNAHFGVDLRRMMAEDLEGTHYERVRCGVQVDGGDGVPFDLL